MDIHVSRAWRRRLMRAAVLLVALPIAALSFAGAAQAQTQPDDGPGLGSVIVTVAQQELNNSAHNYSTGANSSGACNFYSGYWRGTTSGCPTGRGRAQWCADFAKYVWSQAGARVTGLDAWADSFRYSGAGIFHWSSYHGGTYVPQRGDAVMFDWNPDQNITNSADESNDGTPDTDHVAIVTAVSGTTMSIIEGNNGTYVRTNSYSINSSNIHGYATPLWA